LFAASVTSLGYAQNDVVEVKVVPLNNDSYVAPGAQIEVAKLVITPQVTAVWTSIRLRNAGTAPADVQIFKNVNEVEGDRFNPDEDISVSPKISFSIPGSQQIMSISPGEVEGGRSTTFFIVMSSLPGAEPGQSMDVDIDQTWLAFSVEGRTVSAGPEGGYHGTPGPRIAGVTDIAIRPLSDGEYAPYNQIVPVAYIEINTVGTIERNISDELINLIVKTPSSPDPSGKIFDMRAIKAINLYREEGNRYDISDDSHIAMVEGFNPDGTAVFSLSEKIGPEGGRYIIALTIADRETVEAVQPQGAQMFADVSLDSDSFTFRYSGKRPARYDGVAGPFIGEWPNEPPQIIILRPSLVDPDTGERFQADEQFEIQYVVSDSDDPKVTVSLYYSEDPDLIAPTIEETESNLEKAYLISSDELIPDGTLKSRMWNTVDWSVNLDHKELYVYAMADDGTNKRVARSTGSVLIVHQPNIENLSPTSDVVAQDGFFLISWDDRGRNKISKIRLYYSSEPPNQIKGRSDQETIENLMKPNVHLIKELVIEKTPKDKTFSYKWVFDPTNLPKGEYYIYALCDNDPKYGFAHSNGVLDVRYPPSIKLISPIAEGSRAFDDFKISLLAFDQDDDADIDLFYSTDLLEVNELLDLIAKIDAGQNDPVREGRINPETIKEEGVYSKKLNEWYLIEYPWDVSGLSGSYYVYARIRGGDEEAYSVSLGRLTVRKINVRVSPSAMVVDKGNQFSLDIQVDTHGIAISGISVYLSFDTERLQLVDETEPFEQVVQEEGLFDRMTHFKPDKNGKNSLILQNDFVKETGGTRGLLSYSVADPESSDSSDGYATLATLRFIATAKEDDQLPITTYVNFDFDETANRRTVAVVEPSPETDVKEIIPSAPMPALSVQISPLATIVGQIKLEERKPAAVTITFELREPGSLDPYAGYPPEGSQIDEDADTPGVQVTTNPDGTFTLKDIPTGRWELTAKVDSFLRGEYVNAKTGSRIIEVVSGDVLRGVKIYNAEGDDFLLGGDIDGDNRININDFSALAGVFGLSSTDTDYDEKADLNLDGFINAADLAILAKNFGKLGIPSSLDPGLPSPSPGGISDPIVWTVAPDRPLQEGEVFKLDLWMRSQSRIRGFAFEAIYDPLKLKPIGDAVQGNFLESTSKILFICVDRPAQDGLRRLIVAGMIAGQSDGVEGEGVAATISFRSLGGGPTEISLQNVFAARVNGELLGPIASGSSRLLLLNKPVRTELGQNFPNPFNPETWIPFKLSEASQVSFRIFDPSGRLVRQIDLGYLPAGDYTVKGLAIRWDGRNDKGESVASGTYFYQLITDRYSDVRRMVILK
jgi:hypothetical protein